nr:MAG TPA: minor capsid protein [Microviridae sp.]
MALSDNATTLIGAGVSSASGLIGGGISAIANRRAQKRAMKFAREQMAWNANEAQKNRDFQKKMFDETNDWNSAYSQRKRLEAAGLNPYLMMDGGSAGTAQSVSGDSASYSSMPDISAPDLSAISGGINTAGSTISNLAMQRAEIRARNAKSNIDEIDGITRGLRNLSEIGLFNSQRDRNIVERNMTEFILDFNREMRQIRVDAEKERLDLLRNQNAHEAIMVALADYDLANYPEQKRLQLEEFASTIYKNYASGHLSYASASEALAHKLLLDAQTEGQAIDNKVARETADGIIDAMNVSNDSIFGYYTGNPNDPSGDWQYLGSDDTSVKARMNGRYRGYVDRYRGVSTLDAWQGNVNVGYGRYKVGLGYGEQRGRTGR